MNRINTPTGFRYSNDEHGIANMFLSLEHGVAANSQRRSVIEAGTPVVGYSTDSVRRGTHIIVGMAAGSTGGDNVWGSQYDGYTVHTVRWLCAPVWVPADVAWGTSTNLSGEVLRQMMEYALAA